MLSRSQIIAFVLFVIFFVTFCCCVYVTHISSVTFGFEYFASCYDMMSGKLFFVHFPALHRSVSRKKIHNL